MNTFFMWEMGHLWRTRSSMTMKTFHDWTKEYEIALQTAALKKVAEYVATKDF